MNRELHFDGAPAILRYCRCGCMEWVIASPEGHSLSCLTRTCGMSYDQALVIAASRFPDRLLVGPPIPRPSEEELAALEVEGW